MNDKAFVVLIFGFWLISVGFMGLIMRRIEKVLTENKKDELKLKDCEIEKKVNSMPIDQLIDSNNKDRQG